MGPSELCAVWGCLHDGYIVATSTSEGRVSFDVLCRYMAEALGHPEDRVFRVTVWGPAAWEPWERLEGQREPPSFEDIAGHEAEVLAAEEVGSQVGVTLLFEDWHPDTPSGQSGGRLLVLAKDAALGWADGEPLAAADLLTASARSRDAFGSSKKDRRDRERDPLRVAIVREVSGRADAARSAWPTGCAGGLAGRPARGARHEGAGVEGEPTVLHPCPCCGRCTLDEPGEWDICVVCWWEDDPASSSGPNGGVSLSTARANFLRHGLFDPARSDLARVADPPEKYAVGRVFVFDDDGHVVEVLASEAR